LHLQREDFRAARKAREQLVDITTKVFGDKHWRTIDARVALADVEKLARLDRDQLRKLTEADQLDRKVMALYRGGKFREAVEFARQALENRKHVLGEQNSDYAISLNNLALLYQAL